MRFLRLIVGAVCCLATSAYAADLNKANTKKNAPPPVAAEPAPPIRYAAPYNWTGLYTGAFVGGAHSIWTIDFYRNNNHGHAEESSDGFALGGWVGYNWQVGPHLVYGIEGDLGWTNASQNNQVFDNDHTNSKIGAFGSLRGRVGYAMDRLLIFATAGLAFADISQNIQKGRNAGEQVIWENQTPMGYVIGAGIEYAFDDRWIGRAEYLYSNYGSTTLYNADGNRADFANDMNLLRVGMSYRF
jgi:outer membrane immunogenic protein